MRIALNWYEVTLPTTELKVAVQVVEGVNGRPPKTPRHPHRVIQRQKESTFRFLHITNDPPSDAGEETLKTLDDPTFVKNAVEEGFARLLKEKGFMVCRQQVGSTAYIHTAESMFPKIYTFFRGLSFRCFYGFGPRPDRWGLILNYATSQRFCITLENAALRELAMGKRVVPISTDPSSEEDDRRHSGVLLSIQGQLAEIDQGEKLSIKVPLNEWTLPCRRELLSDYLEQVQGSTASSSITRHFQVASFSLTKAGRMNTALAKDQLRAVQQLLHDHKLARFCLPLPGDPPVSLSDQPLVISE